LKKESKIKPARILKKRSVSGTSEGRRNSNTRGPLSNVIEAAATIIHNWRFYEANSVRHK